VSAPVRAVLTPAFRRAYLVRGVGLWILVRMALAFVMSAGAEAVTGPGTVVAIPYIAGVVFLGVWADARVRREDLLLANAGISPLRGPAVSGSVAFALEVALRVGWSLIR